MYDNIEITIDRSLLTDKLQIPDEAITMYDDGEEKIVEYYTKDMVLTITVSKDEVRIIGSISKYFSGSDFHTLTKRETSKAFVKLGKELKLPIPDFKVLGFSVGSDIEMDYPVNVYLDLLGSSSDYDKRIEKGVVGYWTAKKQLLFFDKLKDIKEVVSEDRNMLRYSLTHYEGLEEEYGVKDITVKDLYSNTFYKKLVGNWIDEYNVINKFYYPSMLDEAFESTDSFQLALMTSGINCMGGDSVIYTMIEQAYQKGQIKTLLDKKDFIEKVDAIRSSSDAFYRMADINELSGKIFDKLFSI